MLASHRDWRNAQRLLDTELLVMSVPMPASLKISKSAAWGTRPSMIWALVTPSY